MTRKVLFAVFCALALIGCKKESAETVGLENVIVLRDAIDVTPFSATLSVSFRPLPFMNLRDVCLFVSEHPETSGYRWCCYWYDEDAEGDHEFKLTELDPGTTYYYWAELRYNTVISYHEIEGEVRSFTTPSIVGNLVTTNDPEIESGSVLLRGAVSSDIKNLDGVSVWFEWGEIKAINGERGETKRYDGKPEGNGNFSYIIGGVDRGYYRAGITFKEKDYFGEEKTWTLNQ